MAQPTSTMRKIALLGLLLVAVAAFAADSVEAQRRSPPPPLRKRPPPPRRIPPRIALRKPPPPKKHRPPPPKYGECPDPQRDRIAPYCTVRTDGYNFWSYDGEVIVDIRNLRIGVWDNCDGPIGIGRANVTDVIKKRGMGRGVVTGMVNKPIKGGMFGPYREDAMFTNWERVFRIYMNDAFYTYTDSYMFTIEMKDRARNTGVCYLTITAQWLDICTIQTPLCPKDQVTFFPCGYDPAYPPKGYPANPSVCDCIEYYPQRYWSQCRYKGAR